MGWVVGCGERGGMLQCCCCGRLIHAVGVVYLVFIAVLLLCLVGEEEGGEGVWMWFVWLVVVLVCLVHTLG